MIEPDAPLVRRLRNAARAKVWRHPVLREYYQKPPGFFRRQRRGLGFRWVVPAIFFGAAFLDAPTETLFAYGVLWTLCLQFSRANQWTTSLQSPADLWVYYQNPVTNEKISEHLQSLWLRGSLWLAFDWFALGLGLALLRQSPSFGLVALALAGAQWAVSTSLAAWAVVRWPRFPYGAGLFLSGALLAICVKMHEHHPSSIQPVLDFALHLTPLGWLAKSSLSAGTGEWQAWLGLIGVGLSASLFIAPALTRLRSNFRVEPLFGYDLSEHSPCPAGDYLKPQAHASDDEPALTEPVLGSLPPPDPVAIRRHLHELLAHRTGRVLTRGTMELAIRRTFSRRQKVLVEQLRPNPPWSWSRGWVIALGCLLFARVMQLAGIQQEWIAIFVTGALGLLVFPILGGLWTGFDPAPNFQNETGLYAFVPIGFWESVGLMLQVNVLRILAGVPLLLPAVRFGYAAQPLSWTEACDWSARVIALIMAVQPIGVIIAFSKTSNDSSSRWWLTVAMALGLILCLLGLVGGGVGLFAVPDFGDAMIFAGALNLGTGGLLLGYGLAYRYGLFDLMKLPRDR